MDRQPVLEGERLLLRPLQSADWDALFAVASQPEVWAQHPCDDRWQEAVFRAFFDDALAQRGALAVIDKASGRLIGSSRFQEYHPANGGVVEIGWTFLDPSQWGSGANGEMKRLMLGYAFGFVERVVFRVGDTNWRSRKAMEKIGGRLTDATESMTYKGRDLLHLVYEIDRAGFAAGPLASR